MKTIWKILISISILGVVGLLITNAYFQGYYLGHKDGYKHKISNLIECSKIEISRGYQWVFYTENYDIIIEHNGSIVWTYYSTENPLGTSKYITDKEYIEYFKIMTKEYINNKVKDEN